jgi:hypothetical protein
MNKWEVATTFKQYQECSNFLQSSAWMVIKGVSLSCANSIPPDRFHEMMGLWRIVRTYEAPPCSSSGVWDDPHPRIRRWCLMSTLNYLCDMWLRALNRSKKYYWSGAVLCAVGSGVGVEAVVCPVRIGGWVGAAMTPVWRFEKTSGG